MNKRRIHAAKQVAKAEENAKYEENRKESTRQNDLVCIFFRVAHRAKQLKKGQKLSNRFAYRCKQRLRRACNAMNEERLMNLPPYGCLRKTLPSFWTSRRDYPCHPFVPHRDDE